MSPREEYCPVLCGCPGTIEQTAQEPTIAPSQHDALDPTVCLSLFAACAVAAMLGGLR